MSRADLHQLFLPRDGGGDNKNRDLFISRRGPNLSGSYRNYSADAPIQTETKLFSQSQFFQPREEEEEKKARPAKDQLLFIALQMNGNYFLRLKQVIT